MRPLIACVRKASFDLSKTHVVIVQRRAKHHLKDLGPVRFSDAGEAMIDCVAEWNGMVQGLPRRSLLSFNLGKLMIFKYVNKYLDNGS